MIAKNEVLCALPTALHPHLESVMRIWWAQPEAEHYVSKVYLCLIAQGNVCPGAKHAGRGYWSASLSHSGTGHRQ